jgi:hypothetical protein
MIITDDMLSGLSAHLGSRCRRNLLKRLCRFCPFDTSSAMFFFKFGLVGLSLATESPQAIFCGLTLGDTSLDDDNFLRLLTGDFGNSLGTSRQS